MEKPNIARDNRILIERTRANKEISEGIEAEVNQLFVLSAAKRAREFLFFGCIYAAGAYTVSQFGHVWALAVIGIVLMGIAINSLGIFIHEGLHGLLAKNHRMNHLLTFLVGLPVMMSASAYYTTHVNHHYELGRKPDYGTYRQHTKRPVFIWLAYFLQLTLGTVLYTALIPFLGFRSASRTTRAFIIGEYAVIIAVFAAFYIYAPAHVMLFYWLYPVIIAAILTNLRGLGSHALGDVENIYLSSRTIKSSRIVSALFINENYHLEHHIFPRTPSYNLPAMHALVWDRLPEAIYSESYPKFLLGMLRAALKGDLHPMGIVHPKDQASSQPAHV